RGHRRLTPMIAERSHAMVVSNRSQPGIARRCADGLAEHSAVPAAVNNVVRAAGRPLDGSTRSFMESQFGHDFGDVRVHAEPSAADSARAVNAMAYTVGRHIVFGAQHYA